MTSAGAWVAAIKGPATDKIGPPIGLSVSNDTLFVADPNHLRVHVLDLSGNEIRFITSYGACIMGRLRDADADAAGNVYVANYDKSNVLKFNSNGTCNRIWGKKGSLNGQFKNPYGVRIGFDPILGGQAVYVTDSNNDRIQEFLTDGTYEAQLGSAGTADGTFTQLRRASVATDGSGDVWGADLWGYRLERFHRTAGGYTYAQTIGGTPPPLQPNAVFNQVRAVDFDSAGNVYTMDTVNQRVVEWTASGSIIRACGQRGFTSVGDFNWPRGLAIDRSTGQIWIADTKQDDIQILGADCSPISKFGTAGSGLQNLNWPFSIAIRQSDRIAWVADTLNNRVVSYSVSTHMPIASFGGLSQPGAVSVMPGSGHILVADSKNNRVLELSDTGGSSIALVRTITDGFSKPEGVAADAAGHIYVADSGLSRIVVLNPDATEAGVISGGLKQPEDVSVDAVGNLWVSDTYNDRVLEYSISFPARQTILPQYVGDLIGPGLADMYPVDIAHTSTDYYVLDPGRYRIVEVDRTTGAIVAQSVGTQGNSPGQIGDARALAVDAEGRVWVADTANNRVEEFDSTLQKPGTVFGGTGTGPGQFQLDYGIAIGQGQIAGNPAEVIYVSDGTGRVQKFDMIGIHIGTFTAFDLSQPRQMAIDPATDNVFVVNAGKSMVDVFDPLGNELRTIGSPGTGPGQFLNEPRGVFVTDDGHVYVTDSGGSRIEVFTTAGAYQSSIGGPTEFVGPRGITITENNILAVTDEWDFALKEYNLAGTRIRTLFKNKPPVPGVNSPRGIRVDAGGRISVVDYWNQRIESVDASGQNAQVFGFRGRRSPPGSLNFAWDLAFQPGTGRIFVANRESNDIVVFNSDGTFIMKWSRSGHTNGTVMLPQGLTFAPDGTLLVADSGNGRIQRFSIDSTGKGTYVAKYGQQGTVAMDTMLLTGPVRFFHGRQLQPREYIQLGKDTTGSRAGRSSPSIRLPKASRSRSFAASSTRTSTRCCLWSRSSCRTICCGWRESHRCAKPSAWFTGPKRLRRVCKGEPGWLSRSFFSFTCCTEGPMRSRESGAAGSRSRIGGSSRALSRMRCPSRSPTPR